MRIVIHEFAHDESAHPRNAHLHFFNWNERTERRNEDELERSEIVKRFFKFLSRYWTISFQTTRDRSRDCQRQGEKVFPYLPGVLERDLTPFCIKRAHDAALRSKKHQMELHYWISELMPY